MSSGPILGCLDYRIVCHCLYNNLSEITTSLRVSEIKTSCCHFRLVFFIPMELRIFAKVYLGTCKYLMLKLRSQDAYLFHRSPNFWQQPVPCLLGEMSGSIHDLKPLQRFGLDCHYTRGYIFKPRIYQHHLHLQTCHLCMLYITLITMLCN